MALILARCRFAAIFRRPDMFAVLTLCFVAALAALGGLASAGLALTAGGLSGASLVAAPVFGVLSLASGLGAAVLVLRRQGGVS
jgi:hypothetical protein